MTFVHAYCRNGDEHIGHMSEWGSGWAVIGGTRIEGVAFIDAMSGSGSGGRGPAPQEDGRSHGPRSAAAPSPAAGPGPDAPGLLPAAGPTPSVRPGLPFMDGHGNRPGRWTCSCSHTRVAHTEYGVCCMPGCRCDRFKRPVNDDAASPDRPAAS